MADHDDRMHFTADDPVLRMRMPRSLLETPPLRPRFDQVRDPLIAAERKAMQKTEAQRRGEQQGSLMVQLDKPFPVLRPKQYKAVLRRSFNQAWIKEYQRAQMARFETQSGQAPVPEHTPTPMRAR